MSKGHRLKVFLLKNSTLQQTVAKNTFWLAASNMGGRLLRAVIIIYAARVLGVTEWGVFSYAITLSALMTVFIDFGINHIVVREVGKILDSQRKSQLISTAFFIKIGLLFIGILVILFAAPHFSTIPAAKAILPLIALLLAFDSLREFGFSLARASEKMEWEAGLSFVTNSVIVIFGFLFLWLAPSVQSFTLAYVIGSATGTIITFFTLRHYFFNLISNFSLPDVRFILTTAWPFAVSTLLGGLMINTDIFIISWLRSASDVGLYSAGQRIIQILYIVPSILATSALPIFGRLAIKDDQRMRQATERILGLILLLAIPLALGGFLLGPQIISLAFGEAYAGSVSSFQILALTILADFPAVILANAIFAYNKQRGLIIYSAIGGFLNVILDLLFIPYWGIAGCALSTLIAQIVSNIYLWSSLKKINPFSVGQRLYKIMVATIAMGATIVFLVSLSLHILIIIPLASLLYIASLVALKDPLLEEGRALWIASER